MKNAAVKVASPAHACGIHVYVCSTGILVLPKRSEEYLYDTDVAILASSICL